MELLDTDKLHFTGVECVAEEGVNKQIFEDLAHQSLLI
jgi:hypothetical protein